MVMLQLILIWGKQPVIFASSALYYSKSYSSNEEIFSVFRCNGMMVVWNILYKNVTSMTRMELLPLLVYTREWCTEQPPIMDPCCNRSFHIVYARSGMELHKQPPWSGNLYIFYLAIKLSIVLCEH